MWNIFKVTVAEVDIDGMLTRGEKDADEGRSRV